MDEPLKLRSDNPGGEWLENKRKVTDEQGRHPWGAPKSVGTVTATFNRKVLIPVRLTTYLDGLRGEHLPGNTRESDLQSLKSYMAQKGKLPPFEMGGSDDDHYAPFIVVTGSGMAYLSEGNHRCKAARALDWEYLPCEVRYFNGGELVEDGAWRPAKIKEWDARAHSAGFTLTKYAQPKPELARTEINLNAAFRRWFGASRIRKKDGTPRVMYHGTAADFKEFRAKQAGAIFLTEDPEFAESFSDSSQDWLIRHAHEFLLPAELDEARQEAQRMIRENNQGAPEDSIRGLVVDYLKTDEWREALLALLQTGPLLMPLYVRCEDPFDWQDPDHIEALDEWRDAAKYTEDSFSEEYIAQMRNGSWDVIEKAPVQRAIRALGHDGFWVKEGGRINLAVYSPNQVKAAYGNNGQWSLTDNDITAKPQAKIQMPSTPEFRRWFGHSVVKEPVFHLAQADFKEFDPSRSDLGIHFGTEAQARGRGDFLVQHEGKDPTGYNTMACWIRIEKPLRLEDQGMFSAFWIAEQLYKKSIITRQELTNIRRDGESPTRTDWDEYVRECIKQAGFDGVVYANHEEGNGEDSWIVFAPEQIKSAISNNGEYDPRSTDITAKSALSNSGKFDPESRDTTAAPKVPVNSLGDPVCAPEHVANFKAWFLRSKVVDEQKRPLVVYHGTPSANAIRKHGFDNKYLGSGNDQYGSGFYFTSKADVARGYKSGGPDRSTGEPRKVPSDHEAGVLEVYLRIQKPIVIKDDGNGTVWEKFPALSRVTADRLIRLSPESKDPDGPLSNYGDVGYSGRESVIRMAVDAMEHANPWTLCNDFYDGHEAEFLSNYSRLTGYDGVFVQPTGIYVAWFPRQIKTVDNDGSFSESEQVTASDTIDSLTRYWSQHTWPSEDEAREHIRRRLIEDNERYPMFKPSDPATFALKNGMPLKVWLIEATETSNGTSDDRLREEADADNLIQITPSQARALVDRKTEKPGGVNPPVHIGDGDVCLYGMVPLSDIRENEGDMYDGTVDADRARDYSTRDPKTAPPVILARSRRTGTLNVLDGGHRVSAARMRGDARILAIVLKKQATKASGDDSGAHNETAINHGSDDPDGTHRQAMRDTGFWGKQGAGCIVVARNSGRVLIGLRSGLVLEPGTWGTWGGALDPGLTPEQGALAELIQETNCEQTVDFTPLLVFQKGTFRYSNFLAQVDHEFTPELDWENDDSRWVDFGDWPHPLHPGLKALLDHQPSVEIIERACGRQPVAKGDEHTHVKPERVTEQKPSDARYAYHATSIEAFPDIVQEGLKAHEPWEYTDQDAWPDGKTEKRSYFAGSFKSAMSFFPTDTGWPVMLRMRKDRFHLERELHTGDMYSRETIPAEYLEYLGEDDDWHNVLEAHPDAVTE